MKLKIIGVIAASLLLVSLVGCDKGDKAGKPVDKPAMTTPAQTSVTTTGVVALAKDTKNCTIVDAAADGSSDAQKNKPKLKNYARTNKCTKSTGTLNTTYNKAYKEAKMVAKK